MVKNDPSLFAGSDIWQALGLLTRLPVPMTQNQRSGRAAWAYPLVGLVTGALAALAGMAALWLGLPSALVALISLAVLLVVTGAMHEDGLADTADGFWGGWTINRRLEIMKDSYVGAYGSIALFLGLSARWSALWLLYLASPGAAVAGLLVSGALSRAMMPVLMTSLPPARQTGLSQSIGNTPATTALTGLGIAVLIAILLSGFGAFWVILWALAITYGMGLIANRKIGGQTGDVLGATQQLVEIAVLFSLLA